MRYETVEQMSQVVEPGLRDFGRLTKLSRADQLLMTLMYWREYRTEFHIGLTWRQRVNHCCHLQHGTQNRLLTYFCKRSNFSIL
jgi:hypothetical protein